MGRQPLHQEGGPHTCRMNLCLCVYSWSRAGRREPALMLNCEILLFSSSYSSATCADSNSDSGHGVRTAGTPQGPGAPVPSTARPAVSQRPMGAY